MRGYSYDRRDVTGRLLANAYAQMLGRIFIEQQKPFEVEMCVAEVGEDAAGDQLYRITYDGSITDEPQFVVMGGRPSRSAPASRTPTRPASTLAAALGVAVEGLQAGTGPAAAAAATARRGARAGRVRAGGRGARPGPAPRRAFRRITGATLRGLLPAANRGTPDADQEKGGDDAPAASGAEDGTSSTHVPCQSRRGGPATAEHRAGHRHDPQVRGGHRGRSRLVTHSSARPTHARGVGSVDAASATGSGISFSACDGGRLSPLRSTAAAIVIHGSSGATGASSRGRSRRRRRAAWVGEGAAGVFRREPIGDVAVVEHVRRLTLAIPPSAENRAGSVSRRSWAC